MSPRFPFIAFLIFAGFLLVNDTMFVVDETKQALVLQFGDPKQQIREAGLYFKLPLIQQVHYYEKRVLDVDMPSERVLLASTNTGMMAALAADVQEDSEAIQEFVDNNDGGAPIIVDTFARYRITDPLKFRQRLTTEQAARLRIANEMESATRDIMGRSTIEQLLSPERTRIMANIKKRVNNAVTDFGIEIIDVRINRADLTDNLKEATFNRMRSERQQRAAEIRSMGEKRALEIRSNADKERTILLAQAQREAQILRGTGDEEASNIYARAYQQDPEFYNFYRSLEAYRNGLGRKETTLILSPDSDFFDILRSR